MFAEVACHWCDNQPQEVSPLGSIAKVCGGATSSINSVHVKTIGEGADEDEFDMDNEANGDDPYQIMTKSGARVTTHGGWTTQSTATLPKMPPQEIMSCNLRWPR